MLIKKLLLAVAPYSSNLKLEVLLISGMSIVFTMQTRANELIPLEYFAMRPVVGDVALSPDGKRVAVMKIPTKDGNPVVEVYETDNMEKKPFSFNANPMEITSVFAWVSNDLLVFSLRQKVRDIIDGFNQGVYDGKLAYLDMKEKKLESIEEVGFDYVQRLPDQPGKAIISILEGDYGGKSADAPDLYRVSSYYEMDFNTGRKKLILRGSQTRTGVGFDYKGNPIISASTGSDDFVWYHRPPGTKEWNEIYRLSKDSFEYFGILGLDYPREDHALVIAHNGHDKLGLWSFNLITGKFEELIYRRNDVDVLLIDGVRFHSNQWTHPNQVVAISYFTDKRYDEFFDDAEAALYNQLEGLIPNAHILRIQDRTRDGGTMIIFNQGPKDPGTYYLFHKGRLQVVGGHQPLFKSEQLADLRYIQYKARDGKTIPGYLHVPNKGKKPYPLIVMPHGGPFVHETVIYNKWAQMLASRGYLVLQPQYRGSRGHGLDHYKSAFLPKGQGGYKMQDDKDDGALHLVQEGLADRDRLAMFGWSYGGYAALLAASRKEQIYQCVIAGASVSDLVYQMNFYRYADWFTGAVKVEQSHYRDDSISPIDVVDKVNIPLLIVHGDVDQRVPVDHSTMYLKELDKIDIPYKYVVLKGADHFSNTLFFDHQVTLFTSMIDFLENDCGPDGL